MSSPTEQPRRPGVAERVEARSRLLRRLAAVVGLVGFGLVLAFAIQAGLFSFLVSRPAETPVAVPLPTQVTGSAAHYSGLDKSQQPYEISAATGVQDKNLPDLVHLDQVSGTLHRQDGGAILIAAPKGLYDTKARRMDLEGGVKINDGDRFTALMDRAKVGVDDQSILSDSPVTVTMPQGEITANSMEVGSDGQVIRFKGAVKALFGTATANKGDSTP